MLWRLKIFINIRLHLILIAGAPEIPEDEQEPEDEPLGKIVIIFIP